MNSNCNWEKIDSFISLLEYRRFCEWVNVQVDEGCVEKVVVENSTYPSGFVEQWFKCKVTGEVWRLVEPDAPFYGYWGPI